MLVMGPWLTHAERMRPVTNRYDAVADDYHVGVTRFLGQLSFSGEQPAKQAAETASIKEEHPGTAIPDLSAMLD